MPDWASSRLPRYNSSGIQVVSDPYKNKDERPIKFVVTIDSKITESIPARNTDGSVYLKFDLGGLPDGIYTASVKAVNRKGVESTPATYSFKKDGTEVVPFAPSPPRHKIGPSRTYQGHLKD